MSTELDLGLGHTAVHLSDLCTALGAGANLKTLSALLHVAMLCATDANRVGEIVIATALQEEMLMGERPHTWRSAAKALRELATVGPGCPKNETTYKGGHMTNKVGRRVDAE